MVFVNVMPVFSSGSNAKQRSGFLAAAGKQQYKHKVEKNTFFLKN
jgi:hypothetical protein